MEERYEIKGKIGQGGLGTVYKAFDVRMNRDVAIKRIISGTDDDALPAEATRQLLKEAGSLASLQHPNIVTIYDVGEDSDGPFVVMELLTGDTLEGIISKGSFTWPDFRQLANQTLEALIAAQELHIVHRDLKPTNIMLTWLPSGKFQVKIVDFGLAKLSAKPTLQTIDQSDGVFGSIYFMAPEQFERVPIDLRTDIYAIACVYYYALTGTYPFDGDSAVEVMAAHLQHHVTPLQDVREGIPIWACEWIMWLLNRQPADRPASAREALQVFLEQDEVPSPPLSQGPSQATPEPTATRPKLIIPGASPTPEPTQETASQQYKKTASIPKALQPPSGSKPSVHTSAQVVQSSRKPLEKTPETQAEPSETPEQPTPPKAPEVPADTVETPRPDTASTATTPQKKAAPAPILRKASAKSPSIPKANTLPTKPVLAPTKTNPAPKAPTVSPETALPVGSPTAKAVEEPPPETLTKPIKQKKSISKSTLAVATIALLLVSLIVGYAIIRKLDNNSDTAAYNEMVAYAGKGDATELPVDRDKLEILLRNAASTAASKNRNVIYKALVLAKATDDTNIDQRIADFATTTEMIPDVRIVLLRDVLRKRNNPEVVDDLLNYAAETSDTDAAIAALEATRFMAGDRHFPTFLATIQSTTNQKIRKAAEENTAQIIEKSSAKPALGKVVASAYETAINDEIRHTMLRLLSKAGGPEALAIIQDNLQSNNNLDKIAAFVALENWPDHQGFEVLTDFLGNAEPGNLRKRAFDSTYRLASNQTENIQETWTKLHEVAKTPEEHLDLIRGLANVPPQPWVYNMLDQLISSSESESVIDLAERAKDRLQSIEEAAAQAQ